MLVNKLPVSEQLFRRCQSVAYWTRILIGDRTLGKGAREYRFGRRFRQIVY